MKYYHVVLCNISGTTCICGIYTEQGAAEERAKSIVGADNVRVERWAERCAIFIR